MRADIEGAEVVLPARALDETVAFFVERFGFRVEAIHPADAPTVAVIVGHGVRLRLDGDGAPGRLRLRCAEAAESVTAPNGTRVEIVAAHPPLVVPPAAPSFVLTRAGDDAWHTGRAGMRYRDLIPDRWGGRFIASHIAIPEGGDVADYAHYHRVRFQMIYCARGWVRVVYEDQGPPFELRAGDCVLQPPEIRHRVLASSPGLEVVEIGCPAEHETCADLTMALPTEGVRPAREFAGQRFVRHDATRATWHPWRVDGFECRDLGIGAATAGLAGARVVRPAGAPVSAPHTFDTELLFAFVLAGTATLVLGAEPHALGAADAFALPSGAPHALTECSNDFALLDVTLPATV